MKANACVACIKNKQFHYIAVLLVLHTKRVLHKCSELWTNMNNNNWIPEHTLSRVPKHTISTDINNEFGAICHGMCVASIHLTTQNGNNPWQKMMFALTAAHCALLGIYCEHWFRRHETGRQRLAVKQTRNAGPFITILHNAHWMMCDNSTFGVECAHRWHRSQQYGQAKRIAA